MRSGIVVVGAGHAGVQVADELRSGGYSGPVTLIAGEPHRPYARPPVSKQFLDDDTDPAAHELRTAAHFREQEIRLLHGPAAVIDPVGRVVHLVGGSAVGYDHLVLATGARPRRLAVPGAGLSGVLALRTYDDAVALRARLSPRSRVVVLGGGFIGLEVASAARRRGAEVTVLERADRLLGRMVTLDTSRRIAAHHVAEGVQIGLGEAVSGIVGEAGRVTGVRTASGRVVPADVVVVGVGAVADDELAAAAGLATESGVLVDQWLTTTDPRISAIGDCAAVLDPPTGTRTRIESIQNATEQARYVAASLLGTVSSPYRALPWFWSDQGSLRLQMVVRSPRHDHTVLRGTAQRFTVLRFGAGVLTGVESVNDPGSHHAARRLLDHAEPSLHELEAVDFDLGVLARQVMRGRSAVA